MENNRKHLGLFLYVKLNFLIQISEKIKKGNKGSNLLKKINLSLPRFPFVIVCGRHHLDYGDIIYDQPSNVSFSGKKQSGTSYY